MSTLLYNIFLLLYSMGVKLSSLWNSKAQKWLNGREGILHTISEQRFTNNGKLVWMHCASLGEFEQGRPLIEELKIKHEQLKVVLTFFSPSGYEVMKDYSGADHIFYLPMDSPANAKQFLDSVNPSLVIWVKYEYWFYYLVEIKKRNIPAILVSGIFRKNQPFFRWYGNIWKKMLDSFTHFFVQNEESKILLSTIGITDNVTINGDTRFDRVIEIANTFKPVPFIAEFCGNSKVIVAGSTWEEDEIELYHFVKVHPEIKFIIAPHEIDEENLDDVKDEFPHSLFYSELEQTTYRVLQTNPSQSPAENLLTGPGGQTENILIIDNIGMLSRLYKYATVAFVGGGFGDDGVHNVLEAAVYGKPVVFGPVYEKFDEAVGLINEGGGISTSGPIKLEEILNRLFNDDEERKRRGEASKNYVHSNSGASQKIIQFIQEKRLLTNW